MFSTVMKADPYLVQKHGVKGMKHGVRHAITSAQGHQLMIDHHARASKHHGALSKHFYPDEDIAEEHAYAKDLHDKAKTAHQTAMDYPASYDEYTNAKKAASLSKDADDASASANESTAHYLASLSLLK